MTWFGSQSGTIHDLAKLMTWCGPQFGMAHGLARLTIWHGHGAGMAHHLAQPRIWPGGLGALSCAAQCHLLAEATTVSCPRCHRAPVAIVPMPPNCGEDAPQPEHPHRLCLLPEASPWGRKRRGKSSSQATFPPSLLSRCSPGRDECPGEHLTPLHGSGQLLQQLLAPTLHQQRLGLRPQGSKNSLCGAACPICAATGDAVTLVTSMGNQSRN